ncbi:glutamate synthase large subunit [Catenisphaera adipataccumulans]|uniref:Glutamate synthase (Ferredoxin) n=1 Tax=Catenisphaera adipataccumulans TaxID=700500 RepID=A0A7W8FVM6_9FIRM|nr:glutamate synthase large subunit [Catenisphaera adipataccumulans]MBB5183308.1 glutamate synthase (ferredoxin) [Catenisphaera adipataccumulans]
MQNSFPQQREHDACGIGMIVNMDGKKSHQVVNQALQIVERLDHRAGKDATGKVGDGVGILLQISHSFFAKKVPFPLTKERGYGVGMFFFEQDYLARNLSKRTFTTIAETHGAKILGWRKVECHPEILGEKARDCMPYIEQVFIDRPEEMKSDLDFDRYLYVIRREFEKSSPKTYVASLSCRTIVYKGMFLVNQLRSFYPDLQDPNYQSAIAIVHSRFSTNTTPSWSRAHPNRFIAHNGEINTIRGNYKRMLAREESMYSPFMDKYKDSILPALNNSGSDSAMLDNTLEFMVMNGMDLAKAVMITIPEPWKQVPMPQSLKDFYHYYATVMEPWDGPAAILYSDGDYAGAVLDRNGLRPCRYYITKQNQLILASEVGVLDIRNEDILRKDRLKPGQMLLVDLKQKKLIPNEELKAEFAHQNPYGEWLDQYLLHLNKLDAPDRKTRMYTQEERNRLYKAFAYTYEDVMDSIVPMVQQKKEPIGAMGVDVPLAVLSKQHPTLDNYFKQLFAQVTNPPMDSLREEVVTDTTVYLGAAGNVLQEEAENCRMLEITNPILDARDMDKIRKLDQDGFKNATVSLLFYRGMPLKDALDHLFIECERAYHRGCSILILSDRGVDENHMAIPSLLAVSAVEQYFVRTKKKTAISIVLESGEPRTVHQFACLLGYGASAIYPYLAHECIEEMIDKDMLDEEPSKAIEDYNRAILEGIVKIASKMGISTLQSYQSAQIFEAIGLAQDVVDEYFTGTVNEVGGIGLKEIEEDLEYHHNKAFDPLGLNTDETLDSIGFHKLRSGEDKEDHLYDPKTIVTLQKATQNGDYQAFKEYSALVNDKDHPHTLRSNFEFVSKRKPIPIEEVEPASEIVKRFKTGAMSYGSISEEAHTCMAIAMNTLGGKSNTGEGGEKPERFGTIKNSAIKQVASGRFGVTSEYLVSAKEIQIKMAQGAKPGEGGHLPGQKVYPWVAKTRYSTPGVTLISPPPHHDIYSIEDLAQLIYDLKNANRAADISVKLVSENGVGTVACGVAKAGATVILISGYDGGTGAAPLSSIHNAGLPWELGLSQTHQALVQEGLRDRVRLETDGKLMTGRDVAIAALLGAEEFGFATAPLISMGCRMMRVCNKDTCPFGIATQNETLRKRFKGKPEYVENFMLFIAEEVREIMAKLGFKTLAEMVGHTDCLEVRDSNLPRQNMLNYQAILRTPAPVHFEKPYDFHLEKTIDEKILLPTFEKAIQKNQKKETSIKISSTNRTLGTILGSVVTQSGKTFDDDTFTVHCQGGAGQSFGAFLPKGITLEVAGDANDYFGKGLSGGKLILYPPKNSIFKAEENVIVGNVALFGATGGTAYIRGIAGERFCVRNSGAVAVAEGCGDHGLEYMTGGIAMILGKTGKNFASGMSGGIAYVWDKDHDLYLHLNKSLVKMEAVQSKKDKEKVQELLDNHYQATGSAIAERILADFENNLANFKKIVPRDYEMMNNAIKELEDKGYTPDEARLKAFRAKYH